MFFQRISRLPPKIKTSSNDPGSTSPKTSSKSVGFPPTLILLCRLIAFIDLTAGQQGATTQWGRDDDDEVDADVDIVCAWRRRRPDTPDYTHTLALPFVAIPLRLLFFGTLLLVIVVRIIIIFIIVIIFSSSLSSALGVLTFQIHCEWCVQVLLQKISQSD